MAHEFFILTHRAILSGRVEHPPRPTRRRNSGAIQIGELPMAGPPRLQ
jgi:hypothetical protein